MWQASAEGFAASRMTAFMRAVQRQYGVCVPDYAALYDWSIREPQQFWRAV